MRRAQSLRGATDGRALESGRKGCSPSCRSGRAAPSQQRPAPTSNESTAARCTRLPSADRPLHPSSRGCSRAASCGAPKARRAQPRSQCCESCGRFAPAGGGGASKGLWGRVLLCSLLVHSTSGTAASSQQPAASSQQPAARSEQPEAIEALELRTCQPRPRKKEALRITCSSAGWQRGSTMRATRLGGGGGRRAGSGWGRASAKVEAHAMRRSDAA